MRIFYGVNSGLLVCVRTHWAAAPSDRGGLAHVAIASYTVGSRSVRCGLAYVVNATCMVGSR